MINRTWNRDPITAQLFSPISVEEREQLEWGREDVMDVAVDEHGWRQQHAVLVPPGVARRLPAMFASAGWLRCRANWFPRAVMQDNVIASARCGRCLAPALKSSSSGGL